MKRLTVGLLLVVGLAGRAGAQEYVLDSKTNTVTVQRLDQHEKDIADLKKKAADQEAVKADLAKVEDAVAGVRAEMKQLKTEVLRLLTEDKAHAPATAKAPVVKTWQVATLPGEYTEDQLRAIYPGIRFPHDPEPKVVTPAAGVAATHPFVPGVPERVTTPATPARPADTAATPPTSSLAPARGALTYTVVPSAGPGGFTSGGCAGGACNAAGYSYPARRGLFGWR